MKFEERKDANDWVVTSGKLSIENTVNYLIKLEYDKECTKNDNGELIHNEGKSYIEWLYEKDLLYVVSRKKKEENERKE